VLEGNGSKQGWTGSWSTPIITKTGTRDELVVAMPGDLRSFDPATGKEIWHCSGMNSLIYANPLVVKDVIVGMGGFGGWAIGVKKGGSGDVTATHRLWQEKRNGQRIGSGVVKDNLIYMTNEPGIVECIDPQTGASLWKERPQVPSGRASSWSSLVLAGDKLYLVTQASDTVIMKAADKFEQLGVNSLGDGLTNSSLVISDGDVFIRTHKHLWCISDKK
jgi:outer membrane protein assembly factor BamB